jgi:hypothetical protein
MDALRKGDWTQHGVNAGIFENSTARIGALTNGA